MISRTTGLKYLSALFDLCEQKGIVEEIKESLVSLSRLAEESQELREFIHNPRAGKKEKKRVLLEILEGGHPLFLNFVCLLVDRGREGVLLFAGDEFSNLLRQSENVLMAHVETVHDFDDAFRADLKARLGSLTGKTIELVEKKNEELLGGIRVIFGSKMIDASVKSRLESMRRILKGGAR